MIDCIFEQYQIPPDYPKNPLGTLYFILRKAELAKDLSNSEWEWLDSHQMNASISVIKSQEQYRKTITDKVSVELASLRRNPFIASTIFTIPSLDSERAFVFYKVNNNEELSESELKLIDRSYKSHVLLTGLKSRLGLTEDFKLDSYALKILSQVELGQRLSAKDIEWLHVNAITSVLPLLNAQASALFIKYKIEVIPSPDLDFLKLFLILQKVEERIILVDDEKLFLAKSGFIQAHIAAKKVEFIALKIKFLATAFESDDPSQHLYKVLKKISAEIPLTEPDLNYLKKRKLVQTLKLTQKRKADQLRSKVEQGYGLRPEDIAWCQEHDYFEIVILALAIDYDVRYRNDAADSPLYAILLKLNSEQRLSDEDVIWLEGEKLLRPGSKIYIAHHRLAALHFEEEFQRTKGYWNVVNASAHWRKADEPKTALKLTNNLQHLRTLKEAKLKSALFTTRGGALRDLEHFSDAESCALEAISHYPDSHNPYTLMGALCYDNGRYEQGDEWFEKAVKRGAKIKDQDSELKRILSKKKGKELQDIIDHLVKKDPERFKWVKQYAKK
jgi:hypothetical protein